MQEWKVDEEDSTKEIKDIDIFAEVNELGYEKQQTNDARSAIHYEIMKSYDRLKEILTGNTPTVVITCNSKPHHHCTACYNTDFGFLDVVAQKAPTFRFGVLDLNDILPKGNARMGWVMFPHTFIYHPRLKLEFIIMFSCDLETYLPWLEEQASKGIADGKVFLDIATFKLKDAGVNLEYDELTVEFLPFFMAIENLMEDRSVQTPTPRKQDVQATKPVTLATQEGLRAKKKGPGRPKKDQVPKMKVEMKFILKDGSQTYKTLRKMIKGATTDKQSAFKTLRDAGIIEKVAIKAGLIINFRTGILRTRIFLGHGQF